MGRAECGLIVGVGTDRRSCLVVGIGHGLGVVDVGTVKAWVVDRVVVLGNRRRGVERRSRVESV